MRETRANRYALPTLFLPLAIFATVAVRAIVVLADPAADRCTKDIEKAFDQCVDGKHEVWYYDFSDRDTAGHSIPSSPYKSNDKAQRALDADQELCQLVDRYWEHTDCQTQYGDVYCAACGKDATKTADTSDSVVQLALDNATGQVDRLIDEIKSLAQSIRSVEKNGHSNQFAGVGNAAKEYWRLLQDAKTRARQLQQLMGKVATGQKSLVNQLDGATREMSDAFGPIEAAKTRLSREITAASPRPATTGQFVERWGPHGWTDTTTVSETAIVLVYALDDVGGSTTTSMMKRADIDVSKTFVSCDRQLAVKKVDITVSCKSGDNCSSSGPSFPMSPSQTSSFRSESDAHKFLSMITGIKYDVSPFCPQQAE